MSICFHAMPHVSMYHEMLVQDPHVVRANHLDTVTAHVHTVIYTAHVGARVTITVRLEVSTCGAGAGQGQEKSWGDRAGPPVRVRQAGGWPQSPQSLFIPVSRAGQIGVEGSMKRPL